MWLLSYLLWFSLIIQKEWKSYETWSNSGTRIRWYETCKECLQEWREAERLIKQTQPRTQSRSPLSKRATLHPSHLWSSHL